MRLFRKHNCAARLQDEGWQIFDPAGWEAHQDALAHVAVEAVNAARRGIPSHALAAGIIGAFWNELGDERAHELWARLTPLRLSHNGEQAVRTARQMLHFLGQD